jgi:hypothetical protein
MQQEQKDEEMVDVGAGAGVQEDAELPDAEATEEEADEGADEGSSEDEGLGAGLGLRMLEPIQEEPEAEEEQEQQAMMEEEEQQQQQPDQQLSKGASDGDGVAQEVGAGSQGGAAGAAGSGGEAAAVLRDLSNPLPEALLFQEAQKSETLGLLGSERPGFTENSPRA